MTVADLLCDLGMCSLAILQLTRGLYLVFDDLYQVLEEHAKAVAATASGRTAAQSTVVHTTPAVSPSHTTVAGTDGAMQQCNQTPIEYCCSGYIGRHTAGCYATPQKRHLLSAVVMAVALNRCLSADT